MRRVALIAVFAAGCSDPKPKPATAPAKDAAVAIAIDAPPRSDHRVTLTPVDPQVTQPVTASSIVVLQAHGALAVVSRWDGEVDAVELAALDAGTVVTVDSARRAVDERTTNFEAARLNPGSGIPPAGVVSPCANGGPKPGYRTPRDSRPGLRAATTHGKPACMPEQPLVLVDARAPTAALIELLTRLETARIGVTTDGGAHARALAISVQYNAGEPPADDAYHQLRADDVGTAGALIAAIAEQIDAGEEGVAIR